MDRKVILGVGVAAAVGGAAAAAFAAYLVLKDDRDGPVRGSEGIPHTSSRPVSIDVSIPKKHIAHVIGKGGDTIKEIQRKTNTRIHFKDELETDTIRVCTINGQPDEAQLAEILIHQTIANQPRVETLVLMVPSRVMGCIIGRNGENIRSMQNFSKCKIDVERTHGDGPRKVTLMGTGEQIALAKDLIDEKVLMVAERDQAREDHKFYTKKENQSAVRSYDSNKASTVCPDRLDGVASSKTFNDADEFRISPKPSLLYLTSEEDPKSGMPGNIEPKYQQEELRPTGVDKVIEVYVSSILHPSQFYVQKVGPESVALDKLVQDMTAYYNNPANQKLNELTKVMPGDLVCSRISSDNNWYRGRVVDVIVPEDEYDETLVEVDIDFVDFGDCERKPITGVCKLLNEFLNLNFQAIECCLADVGPHISVTSVAKDDEGTLCDKWSEEAADDFERLTHASHWKVVLAKLIGYKNRASNSISYERGRKKNSENSDSKTSSSISILSDIPCVELVDTNSEQDINIGRELVALGHAVYLDGRKIGKPMTKEPTLELAGSKDIPSNCLADEGIGIKENIEETKEKCNIEDVMEGFVHDIVDRSLAQSSGKIHNSNREKEESKSDDAMNSQQSTRIGSTLDSIKALSDTPIKLMPNISSGSSF